MRFLFEYFFRYFYPKDERHESDESVEIDETAQQKKSPESEESEESPEQMTKKNLLKWLTQSSEGKILELGTKNQIRSQDDFNTQINLLERLQKIDATPGTTLMDNFDLIKFLNNIKNLHVSEISEYVRQRDQDRVLDSLPTKVIIEQAEQNLQKHQTFELDNREDLREALQELKKTVEENRTHDPKF